MILKRLGTRHKPNTEISMMASKCAMRWNMNDLGVSPEQFQVAIAEWVHAQEELPREVLECVQAQRQPVCGAVRKGQLPSFEPGK